MANPNGPDDEVIAEAWRLSAKERRSTREISRLLGVSPSTAHEYVKRGRTAEAMIDLLDAAEQRSDATARLGEYARRALAWLEQCEKPAEAAAMFGVLVAIEKRLATMLGFDRPTRIAIGEDAKGDGAAPDAGLLRAVRAMRDRDALDTRELNAGRPGVIEGGGQGNG
jgi:hypothetical protein